MSFRFLRYPAASVLATMLLAVPALAQTRPAEPASPYGGVPVEEIVARVNDQIITKSDYDRALKQINDEMRGQGATMQQISDARHDLLRNMIDRELLISKGKELGITGEDELIRRLDEIRKQYNLASMDDLEKAAEQQGVSFEDFKANIRNQIITEEVMRQEVGAHINLTPGEVQRYYEQHLDQYQEPESVKLSEILIPTPDSDDSAKLAEAEAKANDVEAKLKAGASFADLARSVSAGQTAAQGGDLGTYKRGQLGAKVFEDATFSLPTGGVTAPIRTRQGFVIFKVNEHIAAGVQPFKQVEQQVENDYYQSKMEPAYRAEMNKLRDDAYIKLADGYVDSGATGNKRVNPISYAAYTPPTPKKKKKVERTRFREAAHFRSKTAMPTQEEASAEKAEKKKPKNKKEEAASEKPGKKEKIRFGQAPTKTLPNGPETPVEDAGATGSSATQVAQATEPDNPLGQAAAPEKKTRFSDRARAERKEKVQKEREAKAKANAITVAPPDAAEVADQQTESAAYGPTTPKKKKTPTTTGQKTRLSDRKKDETQQNSTPTQPTPIPPVPGAPAPPSAPANAPQPTTPQQ